MPATRLQRPQVLIAARASSSSLMKHYQLYYQANGRRSAQNNEARPSNVQPALLQYVGS